MNGGDILWETPVAQAETEDTFMCRTRFPQHTQTLTIQCSVKKARHSHVLRNFVYMTTGKSIEAGSTNGVAQGLGTLGDGGVIAKCFLFMAMKMF
jgi:hypothetical protein